MNHLAVLVHSQMKPSQRLLSLSVALCVAWSGNLVEAAEDLHFFEQQVRPLLVEHCYACHSAAEKIKGGLALDSKIGWEKGGDSGTAIVPGNPSASLMMKAVAYTDKDLQMPPKEKLPAGKVGILRKWIAQGAPDPRDTASSATADTDISPAVSMARPCRREVAIN